MHFVLSITSLVAVLAAEPQPPKLALYDAWGYLQYTTGKVGDDYQETSHSLKQGEGLTWDDGDATKEYLYHFTVKAEGEEERTPETWFVDRAATKFEKDRSMQPINVEIDTTWKGGIAIKFKKQKAKTDARARTEFELIELPSMMVVKGCEISLTPESAIIKIPVQGKTEERLVIKNEDVIKIGTNCYQYEHGTHQWFPVDCEHFVKKGGASVTSDDIKQLINAVMHDICSYTISKGKFGRKLLITTPCIEKEEAMRLALDDWSKELDELIDLIRSKDRSKTSRIPDKKSIVSQKIERFVSLKKAYGGVIEAMPSSKQSTFKDKLTMLIAKSCKMTEDKIRSTLSDYDVASRDWLADVKQGTPKKDRKPKKELLYELRSATSGYIKQYRVFIEASVPGDQAKPFETGLSNLDTEFKTKKKDYSKELRDFQADQAAKKAKEQYFDVYDIDEADGDIREYAYGGPYQSQRSQGLYQSERGGFAMGIVLGSSATIVLTIVFCIGLAFGLVIFWGYTQKREKDNEDRNEV